MARKRSSTVPSADTSAPQEAPSAESDGKIDLTPNRIDQPEASPPTPRAPAPRETFRERIDRWFTYVPPTPETAPKYGAITTARETVEAIVRAESTGRSAPDFERVNDAFKTFAYAIADLAPDACADTTAAIRNVRLARNAANALLRRPGDGQLLSVCLDNLLAAQWQANGAIALGGR